MYATLLTTGQTIIFFNYKEDSSYVDIIIPYTQAEVSRRRHSKQFLAHGVQTVRRNSIRLIKEGSKNADRILKANS